MPWRVRLTETYGINEAWLTSAPEREPRSANQHEDILESLNNNATALESTSKADSNEPDVSSSA